METFEFFRPYLGTKPYLFISYAHLNSSVVMPVITKLRYTEMAGGDREYDAKDTSKQYHYLLWYDEGIQAGEDWAASISKHMGGCNSVLFFPSKASFESGNCLEEIRTAKNLNKTVYCIPLDNTPAPDRASDGKESWKSLMDYCTFLPAGSSTEERFSSFLSTDSKTEHLIGTEKDYQSDATDHGGFNWWLIGIILAAILLLGSLFCVYGWYKEWFEIPGIPRHAVETPVISPTPEPVVLTPEPTPEELYDNPALYEEIRFPKDNQQETIIRDVIGRPKTGNREEDVIYKSELYPITELYIFATKDVNIDNPGAIEITEDGRCFMNGTEFTKTGKIENLSVFGQMVNLQKLSLIKQPLESLNTIGNTMERLTELNLACSSISDLSGVQRLEALRILHLEHTKIKNLSPLKGLDYLQSVYVTRDMLPNLELDPEARYDVILIK